MKIESPSKEELEKDMNDYTLIRADDYLVTVEEIEVKEQQKYQSEETEQVLQVQLNIEETRDGDQPVDVEGNDATNRKLFFFARIESLGFQRDGTPSKARQFIWRTANKDVNEGFTLEDTNDLLGREVYASVLETTNSKGEERNKISRFAPVKDQSPLYEEPEDEDLKDIPVVEDDDDILTEDIPM